MTAKDSQPVLVEDKPEAVKKRIWGINFGSVARVAKYMPATFGAVVAQIAFFAADHGSRESLREELGLRPPLHEDPLQIFTSGLTAATPLALVLTVLATLVLGAAAERTIGTLRFIVVAVISQILGATFGLLLAEVIIRDSDFWGTALSEERMLAPTVWLFGVTAFATAWMPTLWRRRIRALLITLAVTMFLYLGVLADFGRGTSMLLGLTAGQLIAKRNLRTGRMSIRELRILLATTVFAISAGPLLSGLNPDSAGPLSRIAFWMWPSGIAEDQITDVCSIDPDSWECSVMFEQMRNSGFGPFLANQLPLVLIGVVCLGLARGRRAAYHLAIFAQALYAALIGWELFRYADVDTTVSKPLLVFIVISELVPWMLGIIILLIFRRAFWVRLDRTQIAKYFKRSGLAFVFTSVLWIVGAMVFSTQFVPHSTISLVLKTWPTRYVPPMWANLHPHVMIPKGSVAWMLSEWPVIIFWIGVAFALYFLLASVPDPEVDVQRRQAKKLLKQGSGDHLAWMTLWPGNRYWITEGGYVAFRVHNHTAITVGEPVTAGADLQDLARQFEKYCTENGWSPAWYSVRRSFADLRAVDGWHSVQVAEESVIDVANPDKPDQPLEFKGKRFQDIRTARNRAGKEGIRAVWTTWDEAGPGMRERIVALSENWVSDKALPEMGFTLGGLSELHASEVHLMVAVDKEENVHGVTSWLPSFKDGEVDGWVLDFMRRDTEGFRPVVEFLIAETALKAHEEGISWISLSGAPLAHSNAEEHQSFLDTALGRVGEAMEPLYGFRSLSAFKRKFNPRHEEWVLCYHDELNLPIIGLAVSKCYLPQLEFSDMVHVARMGARV